MLTGGGGLVSASLPPAPCFIFTQNSDTASFATMVFFATCFFPSARRWKIFSFERRCHSLIIPLPFLVLSWHVMRHAKGSQTTLDSSTTVHTFGRRWMVYFKRQELSHNMGEDCCKNVCVGFCCYYSASWIMSSQCCLRDVPPETFLRCLTLLVLAVLESEKRYHGHVTGTS